VHELGAVVDDAALEARRHVVEQRRDDDGQVAALGRAEGGLEEEGALLASAVICSGTPRPL
jgi:hypothetical protein